MARKTNLTRRCIEAEETAVLDIQFAILELLRENNMTKDELARRLSVSKARISQLFAAGTNPTVKQVARIFDALDRAFKPISVPLVEAEAAAAAKGESWHQDVQLSHTIEEEIVYGRVLDFTAANENFAERRSVAA